MLKKTTVCFIMILCLVFAGFANDADTERNETGKTTEITAVLTETEKQNESSIIEEKPDLVGESLVIYFSRTGEQYSVGVIDEGNTAVVAKMIAEKTGADIFEVLPAEDNYPTSYKELTDVAKKEQSERARPKYSGELPDLINYDTIFIGAPVWWGDWPMIMYTVFENNDFSGKKLVPFSTHEGSGLSGFDRKLSDVCPDAEVLDGLAIRGSDAQNDRKSVKEKVDSFLGGMGY